MKDKQFEKLRVSVGDIWTADNKREIANMIDAGTHESMDYAKFIVNACNNHKTLLEALKRAVESTDNNDYSWVGEAMDAITDAEEE